MDCQCRGGGRINHNAAEKKILVYGYSMGYGKADHTKAVELLKKKYPNYNSITFSNEGYWFIECGASLSDRAFCSRVALLKYFGLCFLRYYDNLSLT